MPETISNPFSSDAWSLTSMTDAILRMPYVPGRVGALGIFQSKGITTTHVQLEEMDGVVSLIPAKLRGEATTQSAHSRRRVRMLNVPHFPLGDTVLAAEVQNVRAFGGTELQGVESVRDDRLAIMARKHDATREYGLIGALKGIILDADGSTVLCNLFTELGVTQKTYDWTLGTPTSKLKGKAATMKRYIEESLGAATSDHIHVFCGAAWFDAFVQHPEVVDAYALWQNGAFKREDQRKGFQIWDIVFEEYVGKVGGVGFVATNEAHAFPVGVPGLYETYFAPADFLEAVNTPGLPRYAKSEPMKFNKGVELYTESNPLSVCRRPELLVKLTTSN